MFCMHPYLSHFLFFLSIIITIIISSNSSSSIIIVIVNQITTSKKNFNLNLYLYTYRMCIHVEIMFKKLMISCKFLNLWHCDLCDFVDI